MKRAVCLILAFLMLTGSVEPGYLLPVSRAEALEAAEQSVCAASEDASPAAQEETAPDAAEPEEESHASEETPEEPEEPEREAKETPEEPEEPEESGKEAGETPEEPEESEKEAGETPDASEDSDKETEEAPDASEESDKEAEEAPDASENSDKETEETPHASEETDKEAEETPEEAEEAPDASEEAPDASEEGDLHPQADASQAVRSVKLGGTLEYSDAFYTDLLRPKSNPTLSVVPIYKDEAGDYVDGPKIPTQQDDLRSPNYLFYFPLENDPEFDHQIGFYISGLPGTVTVDSSEHAVEKYRVMVDPVPDYYEQREREWANATTPDDLTTEGAGSDVFKSITEVVLHLKWCDLFSIESIVPNQGEGTSFDVSITFTLPGTTQSITLNEDDGFSTDDDGTGDWPGIIPSGLEYKINYIKADGYRMDEDESTKTNWEGTVPEDSIEISCVNYPLNMSLPFTIQWKDNDNIKGKQPANTYDCFKLQVRKVPKAGEQEDEWTDFPYKYHATEGDTWTYSEDLTDEALEALKTAYLIEDIPNLDKTGNNYTFRGLSGADKDNNVLEYRVQCAAPDHYTANNGELAYIYKSQSDAERKFTMRLSHSISAQIEWMDDSNAEGVRPNPSQDEVTAALSSLRLYSRGSDGTVTDLTETLLPGNRSTWQWTSSGDAFSSADGIWTLTVPDLPTYTDNNEEIEYFLVHGTDTQSAQGTETVESVNLTQTKVEGEGESATTTTYTYTPHYKNSTGNYASDETRCYDSGTITMLLSSDTSFSANIVWKDVGTNDPTAADTINARPAGTVTLWRYAHYQKGADTTLHDATLDEAFLDEQASQVVYVGADKKEHPLCFDLPAGSQDATLITGKDAEGQDYIKLTYTNSDGTPGESAPIYGTLPSHDNLGRRFNYFVRETLIGNTEGSTGTKDNYSVTYQESNANPHTQGAPGGGTIINTRREKALVTVYKFWRNPDGLSQIDQAKVQLKLSASASESGSAEELEVYDPEEGSYDVLTNSALTEAQTATGFTETIPTAQKSYYVNIYDKNGLPYDMTTATMTEIVTLSSNDTYAQDGSTITLGTGANAVTYKVTTHFKPERSYPTIGGANELKRYQYEQFNTISSTRTYDLIKTWSLNKTDADTERYRANIEQVEMKLQRCLLKDLNTANPGWTPLGTYYLKPDDLAAWKLSSANQTRWESTVPDLPKYADDGNAYYYSATETGFVLGNQTDVPAGAHAALIEDGENQNKYWISPNAYTAFGWGVSYFRDEQKTRVDNHDSPGSGYFTITKSWKDNNDAARPAIKIRIYKRTELAAAIEALIAAGHSGTDNVDWSALDARVSPITPVGPAENPGVNFTDLTSANNYTVYPTFLSLCENNETAARADSMANYVVLEYMLGKDNGAPTPSFDGQTPASYTYAQLASLASTASLSSASGTVGYDDADDARDRDYNVTNTRSSDTFYILNERTGTTTLTLNKTWHDENNRDGLRPDRVEFLLYRDGQPCTDFTGVQCSITPGNISVSLDAEHGKIIATCDEGTENNAEKWTITVSRLPMFSGDSGTLYAYNIDEENDLPARGNDRTVHYLQSRGMVDTSTQTNQNTGTTQHFTINLKNTVAGITNHTAFKYWMDYSVEPKTLRPELVFTLYRYRRSAYEQLQAINPGLPENPTFLDLNGLKPGTLLGLEANEDPKTKIGFEKVLNHNDPVVTTNESKVNGPSDEGEPYDNKPYTWKIDISDLQRFDSEGREYVYVLQEQMSDGGETVRGTYVPTIYRTKNNRDDVFINTITGYLTLSGVKIWNGHESYQLELKDLPEPDVTLYRTTDDALSALSDLNQKSSAEIDAYKSAGTLLELDTIHMGLSSEHYKNKYVFPSYEKQALAEAPLGMERVNGKLMLPKYDVNGQRYTRRHREPAVCPESVHRHPGQHPEPQSQQAEHHNL